MTPPPFTPEEIRTLRARIVDADPDEDVRCPACDTPMVVRPVRPPAAVPYVRGRLRVHCPGCGRSGAIDRRAGPSG